MIQNPHAATPKEIADHLCSDLKNGLDKNRIVQLMQDYGPNQIPKDKPKSRWRILADQLLDPIVYILVIAAVLAFILSDSLEGVAILAVITISVSIGFFMELQAIRSLEALRKMGQETTQCIRSEKIQEIKVAQLVPGDIILLQSGDIVPADARLIAHENLKIKESALTGESVPISKSIEVLPLETPFTNQDNMLFRGTMVSNGSGRAIVTAIGAVTQLGRIQQMGIEATKEITPLEKKLNQLGKWLIWLTLVFAVLIIGVGYIRGKDLLLMIEIGVALAVAAIPEGLPIVATIALAKGMLHLSKKEVIIKKLEAVQTLGATNIICTDKTGTLTQDKMKVSVVVFNNTDLVDLSRKNISDLNLIKKNDVFHKIITTSLLCNNVVVSGDKLQGDSIEVALLDFAKKLEYDIASVRNENPERLELPFDANRKLMATVHEYGHGHCVYVKGAFETLVTTCDFILENGEVLNFKDKKDWYGKVDALASQGLRTLAFAYKETEDLPDRNNLLQKLVFLGIAGFIDPAREDVKEIMDTYKKAGIKVIMATGDHPKTAAKIAEEVGLLEANAPLYSIMEGKHFKNMENANDQVRSQVLQASVFARVSPKQKLDLVTFYKREGYIIGMIGDGINDVPALKKADIGIAMGIRGTEAAREVADVILKNDKFTAITLAIHQGRVIFQNIRQFVVYLLSCNLAEILSVGIAALLNLPSPLLPLQILFLNLVTDTFPALALGLGKGPKGIMEQPPRNPKEPIMTRNDWKITLVHGIAIALAVLGVVVYSDSVLKLDSVTINNMAFYTLVLAQLLNVFNMPKKNLFFFKNEVTQNYWVWGALVLSLVFTFGAYLIPQVAQTLSLKPLSREQWVVTVLFALGALLLSQVMKWLKLVMKSF
ncbi:MAG: cation-transporting P-type ATPase [Maribacter sp.]